MYFKDDWHCADHCGCWKTKDVGRDKGYLAWRFKGKYGKLAEVTYTEYKANPEQEGKTSRDMNIYHVHTNSELISGSDIIEAYFHGFMLQWIAARGKDKIDLAFERAGIWVEEPEQKQGQS